MAKANVEWPPEPEPPKSALADFAKARYQAQLDEAKTRWRDQVEAEKTQLARQSARQDAAQAAEDALRAAAHAAYLDVAKGALDRSLKRAEYLTTAAAAIGTTYTALLGFIYGTTKAPLPPVALVSALFLGGAYFFSSFYVAFLRKTVARGSLLPTGIGGQIAEQRLEALVEWVNGAAMDRIWALRSGVMSLGAGILLLPLPFLNLAVFAEVVLIVLALVAVGLTALGPRRVIDALMAAVGWVISKLRSLARPPAA